jgi:hypothetical protein
MLSNGTTNTIFCGGGTSRDNIDAGPLPSDSPTTHTALPGKRARRSA